MNITYSFCIVMVVYSASNNVMECQPVNRVFSITDEVSSCSGWLSTIIFNFCNNTYKIVKRDTSLMLERMAPKNLQGEDLLIRTRVIAEGRWRRIRRQVATECCLRPCTVADIITYCPDDAKLLLEHPDIFD